jgi:hypothetical protein
MRANVRSGSITSFRAGDVDFRFTLDTGRLSASQRTVETGQQRKYWPIAARLTAAARWSRLWQAGALAPD